MSDYMIGADVAEDPHIIAFTMIEEGDWILWKPQWKTPPEFVLDHKKMEIKTVNEVMGEPPPGCDQSFGETLLARLHVGEQRPRTADECKVLGKLASANTPSDQCRLHPWGCVEPASNMRVADVEQQIWIHALKFSDGREWDALNGWRPDERSLTGYHRTDINVKH